MWTALQGPDMVSHLLAGHNTTVMAYGQTGRYVQIRSVVLLDAHALALHLSQLQPGITRWMLPCAFHSGKTFTLLNGLAADVDGPVARGIIPAFMTELQAAMDSAATSASQISVQVSARQSARFVHASACTLAHCCQAAFVTSFHVNRCLVLKSTWRKCQTCCSRTPPN